MTSPSRPLTPGLTGNDSSDTRTSSSLTGADWFGLTPLASQTYDAFRRDLEGLIAAHRGEFVAYHGSNRIAIAGSPDNAMNQALDAGFLRENVRVYWIEEFDPQEDVEIAGSASL